MTPLAERMVQQVMANGPMTMADYMGQCLMHPELGYYTTRDPLGTAGDFTTSPEISQMFGELLGLALAQAWMDQGQPGRIVLAEAGPGRGTCMADALRATKSVPGFHDAAELLLIEGSSPLRAEQAARLAGYDPVWHESFESLPEGPLYLIANEFFDALPVRQAVRTEGGWRERCVGLSEGALSFGLGIETHMPMLAHRLEDTKPGDVVEFSPVARMLAETIGARIEGHGGAALIIDYGDWRSLGDTVQAVKGHEPAGLLETPGEADLTAHVDFEALAMAAPCAHTRLTPQGIFLERLGITARAQALAKGLSGAALEAHVAAHRRLTHPGEMGTLFKTLGLYPKGGTPPPGLEP
ncbi:class I SAM-dependent methyltransferase [Roseovarius faecimaris]|uniref:Class I SAM-dependent methyltransferase n=1 Tax=Roseovarius faecimaris TaxID=2494550 RepID=A0A6I6INN4_9RHOB|nr:SAM-dependent methyltransferase [Roseovarius faecimaris]QGX97421.1 class I SAM-dependent methyltransferase [Roseovarius faecimaris]